MDGFEATNRVGMMQQSPSRRGVLGLASAWAASAALPLLAACAGPAGRAAGGTETVPALHTEPVTLRLDLKASDEALWRFLAPRFATRFPSITVRPEAFPNLNVDYQAKITAVAAAGQLGDALFSTTATGHFDVLVASNQLRPVDDFVRADRYDLKVYFKPGIDGLTRGGKLYGVPNICHPANIMIFYNRRLMESAGVPLPTPDWTPDDAVAAARKVTTTSADGGGVWGYAPATSPPGMQAMIQSFGGRWLSADGKQAELSRPEARQAITYVADLIHRYKVAPPPSVSATFVQGGSTAGGFLNGRVAMWIGITNNANDLLAAPQVETGTSLLPRVRRDVPRGIMRFEAWSVTAATSYPREAWEITKFITGPESSLARIELPGQALGCSPTAWSDAGLAAKRGPMQQMLVRAMAETTEALPMAANFRNQECEDVLDQKLAPVWSGETQVTNALFEDLQQATQAVLDKPKLV